MSLLEETRQILRTYGVVPKKRLGQNFLVDREALRKMVSYASLSREDTVLEIGAGLGFLTEFLAEKAGRVLAVEVDPRLAEVLEARLGSRENVTFLEGDILRLDVPRFDKVVSTPPYSISSPLLHWLLERSFRCGVLVFQEEFAKKLVAKSGAEDYGVLAVAAYYRAEVELLDNIPRGGFWPQPKVGSVIVRLKPRKPPFQVKDENMLFEFATVLFTQKNRKLRNAVLPFLAKLGMSKTRALALADTLPSRDRRPREMAPEEIGMVANELAERLHA